MNIRATVARAFLAVLAVAMLAAGCGGDDESTETTAAPSTETTAAAADAPSSETRDDVDCSEEGLGPDAIANFVVAYYVVDGELGALCYGDDNPTLTDAWSLLATIAPADERDSLGIFAGFTGGGDGDEVSVAFVNTVNDDGTVYQMSVNVEAAEEDHDDLIVTMAHEFSHVFTALPTQLDRSGDPESCPTFFNGEGCFLQDALMTEWIATFWGDGLIDEIDPDAETSPSSGQERCDLDSGFFGAYAASSPEEDFAESFSAYVLQIPAATPGQQERYDWFASKSHLASYRTAAEAAGLGPLENKFDACG